MPRGIREWPPSMSSAEKTEKRDPFLPAGSRQGVCYTYLLTCADGSLYCGWTNNLERRVKTHNLGRGGKYTRSRRPVTLTYAEAFETRKEAMRREWEIKKLSREGKLRLIAESGGTKKAEEKDGAER